MALWTLQNLRDFCGQATTLACLDDGNVGSESATAVTLLQSLSDAKVYGRLATEYPDAVFPLTTAPELVIMASLHFGKALMFDRRPEYVKVYGTRPRDEAETFLEDLLRKPEYLYDAIGTQIGQKPANVGGAVVDNGKRIIADSADGTYNGGDY